ncbi:DNA invertase Pin-like site-specific DNA recombinase [Anaerobacterium chartisolvens]|uniref:DNA invertase Pin-like site-specific DNA recombinase n=1 Tax=Anaerobacterium chartisolvens TaxID=1297424 RepID=A0A369AWX1_9FIRM|nr:recombinase family protein [Anaerobacterium chartisolvens]RCX13882.1 DNA invertase Pin-like site-specific DNA recombinase [Anaerobacterium chartisolvens]
MKCVAYCRVSKDTEDQLNSLDNQIKHYLELFKKEGCQGAQCGMYYSREGKEEIIRYVPSIFADEGISGTKLKNREAFKYMLECAYKREFDVIYVKNIQRWARNVADGAGVLKKLKVMDIKVIFEDGNINNFEHEMTINILLSTAQEESRAKSAAVQFGLRKAQQAGKWTSAQPYGYRKANGVLRPVDEQLETVRCIFRLYLDGWGSTKISRYLNDRGIPTQKGCKWSQAQIYNIILNKIYIGLQVTHTIQNTDINIDKLIHSDGGMEYTYKSQKPVDEAEWITTCNEELRAVSDETFYAAQEENAKRREWDDKGSRPSVKHIFSNLLYCQHCGRAMRRKNMFGWRRKDGTRNVSAEWVCVNHDMYHNSVCKHRNSWREEKLADRVRAEILAIKNNRDELDSIFSQYIRIFLSSEEVSDKICIMEAELSELKSQSSANLRLFSKNIIDEEQYKAQNDELQEARRGLESKLKRLKGINEERERARKKYTSYVKTLLEANLENPDNVLLKKIISRIEAFTYIDEQGRQVKDIYIVWNILDKTFDDVLYREAVDELAEGGYSSH